MRRRLVQNEIEVLRSLARRSQAGGTAVSLPAYLREAVAPLWRWQLVEVWYRQAADADPALQGPYFSLTLAGLRLALVFAAPRQRRQQWGNT